MARNANNQDNREPLLTISAVSQMLDLHQQTLRKYEEEGLVSPIRSEGGTRMYSRTDVERLRVIITLTRDLGVNLAGVGVVFRMREQLDEMKQIIELILQQLDPPVRERVISILRGSEFGLVPTSRAGTGLVLRSLLKTMAQDSED
jgi:MerR family transcriptional regulator/heat shock protein HspR